MSNSIDSADNEFINGVIVQQHRRLTEDCKITILRFQFYSNSKTYVVEYTYNGYHYGLTSNNRRVRISGGRTTVINDNELLSYMTIKYC